jgi:hypothetical protein
VWAPFTAAFAAIVIDPSTVPVARPIRISTGAPVTDAAEIRAALATEMQSAREMPQFPALPQLPWPTTGVPDPPS